MKNLTYLIILFFPSIMQASDFNAENVQAYEDAINADMKTNQKRIDWSAAEDSSTKQQKFSLLIDEIGGAVLSRQWAYTGGGSWPLIDWHKVGNLKNLINDQEKIFDETHIVAQTDEEMARLSMVSWMLRSLGKDAEAWFEDWLLNVAKGSDSNLKRITFFSMINFAEDIADKTGSRRKIDWNKWETAFNQCDPLGKALLLVCMTDLSMRSEEYGKAASMHESVLKGGNDDLKAIALYAGTRKFGPAITDKWKDIADHDPNPKMKALAQEALTQESNKWSE